MSLPSLYQDFIHLSRYSRWIESEYRRESWEETVKRYFDFFEGTLKEKNKFILSSELRNELETAVINLEIMPSMRALMTAGYALERDNTAGYNC
jgi:ribonucleoside-diphosphate reductase alpha chain